jgi:hypothetical protein
MATWHQQRRPTKLYHDTSWSAVTDPPGSMRSIMLFTTQAEAEAFAAKVPHTYVLKPAAEV